MLKHYVLFTFEKDFFTDEHYQEFLTVFAEIKTSVSGVLDVHIHRNCIDRPANMDLMIEMELVDESILPLYLNHPSHIRMGQKYNPHVTHRVSFDYEVAVTQ